jgi:hypothetical protein
MKILTYAEIEVLQYALRIYMEKHSNGDLLYPLHNKLIAMRSQLECTKYYKDLTPQEIVNTL